MAKFNGLTLASNSALHALLTGTKTESDRNNAIAAVAHFLQGQPDGFGAHLTAIILAQAQSNQAHAEGIHPSNPPSMASPDSAVFSFGPAKRRE